jgi:hypothetical protein
MAMTGNEGLADAPGVVSLAALAGFGGRRPGWDLAFMVLLSNARRSPELSAAPPPGKGPIGFPVLVVVEFSRESIDRPDRFHHQSLRAGDFFLKVCAAALGRRFQVQEPNMDSQQGLADFILKLVADRMPLILLFRHNVVRPSPETILISQGILQQFAIFDASYLEGGFDPCALAEAALQLVVRGVHVQQALVHRFVESIHDSLGFHNRDHGLSKKTLGPLDQPIVALREFQNGECLRVNPGEMPRL